MSKAHTEYYETKYASMMNLNASVSKQLIAGVTGKRVVITDIFFSKLSAGGEMSFFDGGTAADVERGDSEEFIRWFPNPTGSNTHSVSFTSPLKLGIGNDLNIMLDDSDSNWSVLVTYYYL